MSVYQLCGSKLSQEYASHTDEHQDPSLGTEKAPPLFREFVVDKLTLDRLFLAQYQLEYISDYFVKNKSDLRVVSYPSETNTCYEKSEILGGWNPLNIVKAFYLEDTESHLLYGVIVPETGCFLDRERLALKLGLGKSGQLKRAVNLPIHMTYGSCSPFIGKSDLVRNGGRVERILFDKEALVLKRQADMLDDFSFGSEHQFSIQMNYFQCYKMLRKIFGEVVAEEDLLTLSFEEQLVRKRGKLKVDYEFKSLNYRTALFMNQIHGYGDVKIVNDHVDELFIPEVLTKKKTYNF